MIAPPDIPRMPSATLRVIDSLAAVSATAWNALVGDAPLLSHAFLHALHETGCASPTAGWTPRYLTAWQAGELVGAMPLYVKTHSYGEYVFDWSWADAYRRHGRRYYPKLVCAVLYAGDWPPLPARRAARTALEGACRSEPPAVRCTFCFPKPRKRRSGRARACWCARACNSIGPTRDSGISTIFWRP